MEGVHFIRFENSWGGSVENVVLSPPHTPPEQGCTQSTVQSCGGRLSGNLGDLCRTPALRRGGRCACLAIIVFSELETAHTARGSSPRKWSEGSAACAGGIVSPTRQPVDAILDRHVTQGAISGEDASRNVKWDLQRRGGERHERQGAQIRCLVEQGGVEITMTWLAVGETMLEAEGGCCCQGGTARALFEPAGSTEACPWPHRPGFRDDRFWIGNVWLVGLGLGVGVRLWGSEFRMWNAGFWVWCFGFGCGVTNQNSEIGLWELGIGSP